MLSDSSSQPKKPRCPECGQPLAFDTVITYWYCLNSNCEYCIPIMKHKQSNKRVISKGFNRDYNIQL